MSAEMQQVGDRLRRARMERELSLSNVAERAGISIATLSRVETDKQSVDVALLLTLARILGVPAAEIVGDADSEPDTKALSRRLARLGVADRTRVFLDSGRRRDPNQLGAIMDDLLSTIDLLREELVNVQRAVRRRDRR